MERNMRNVRRKDREETSKEFLESVLSNSTSCSLAVATDDHPLLHVAFFAYDNATNEIIVHFSKHGVGGKEIKDEKKVTISIYKYGKLYTAQKAVDFGCEYQSVIIYGKIRILTNDEEVMAAMDIFFNKFFNRIPKNEYQPFSLMETNSIYVVRIKIDEWFGKEHRVPESAPSSFYYPSNPVL